ncbi:hypothetical protein JCM10450v2_001909 [Rhodotorula kratochvilovae]
MSSTAITDDRTCVGSSRTEIESGPMPKPKASFLDEPSLTVGQNKPFFQPISETTGGLIDAIKRLDSELDEAGRGHLISRKRASRWAGRTVKPGCAGLYINPGKVPRRARSSLVRQCGFQPGDAMDEGADDRSSAFLDAHRTRAIDDLRGEYGLDLKDLASFKGETARTLDSHTIRALQAQVEAVNVDHENSNRVKAHEGAPRVAQVAAKQLETEADAKAYTVIANARRAQAEVVEIAAQARAHAARLEAVADAEVKDEQTRRMQLARIDQAAFVAQGAAVKVNGR